MATELISHESIVARAKSWLSSKVDEQTRAEVQRMIDNDPIALRECFYSDLEFGTGGLRGIMGVGSMRINRYTIGMATQGLANYIRKSRPEGVCSVAIAFDSRNNSEDLAKRAAEVLSANGIHVILFSKLRPTPLLSFAVRHFGCDAGIVVTASHNPPEYNGYKVYWNDGAQILPPHDSGIISEVRSIGDIEMIRSEGRAELISDPGGVIEEAYFQKALDLIHAHEAIRMEGNLRIVYTPIHGAGITLVPELLRRAGFTSVFIVKEQSVPDGNFPTVKSPNPEEREALQMALELAEAERADLILATDPDTDRVGIAVRNESGDLELLNGNQAGCLLVWYELTQWKMAGRLDGRQYIASTVVTSDIFSAIAEKFGVPCYLTLTGFKYIAGLIREKEGEETFVAGGEESYGYLVGDFVRDKDAVISAMKFAEIAAWCKAAGRSMWDLLMEIYEECGLFEDQLVSVTLKGIEGLELIKEKMRSYRSAPPEVLGGVPLVQVFDMLEGRVRDLRTGTFSSVALPKSDVLQFVLEDGSKISIRPSGTEPKIKFYFSMRSRLNGSDDYRSSSEMLRARIAQVRNDLGL